MAEGAGAYRLTVSGYTASPEQPGIRSFALDPRAGKAKPIGACAGVVSPSYCMRQGGLLYAASETGDHGGFALYGLDREGGASLRGELAFQGAAGTCFSLVHPEVRRLYGADYESGSVSSCELLEDGSFREPVSIVQHEGHGARRLPGDPNDGRQDGPHVHTLSFVPGTALLAAVDLGLDLIALYRTDAGGGIVGADGQGTVREDGEGLALERTPPEDSGLTGAAFARLPLVPAAVVEVPLGSGPRIVAYHPSVPVAALVCELSCDVVLYRIGPDGSRWTPFARWDLLEGAPAIDGDEPPLAAHCAFSRDGRFLYASTRGVDRLTVFALDEGCGLVGRSDVPCGGRTPRHFALSPDDRFLAVANQTSDDIAVFERDALTGELELAMRFPCTAPSCIIWG